MPFVGLLLPILRTMLFSLVTKQMLGWAVKHLVVTVLEEAVARYAKAAAKTKDKEDDMRARRFSAGLNKIKEAWGVDTEEK